MKNKPILMPAVYTAILFIAGNLSAQQNNNNAVFSVHPVPPDIQQQTFYTDTSAYIITARTGISIKTMRDFMKSFKDAENIQWYRVTDGTMAYFTDKGVKTRASYDNKGNWLYNMRSYDESNLPREIRAQVKMVDYDYAITWINEITKPQNLVYLLHIHYKKSWKTISVCDGEDLEIVEEFEEK